MQSSRATCAAALATASLVLLAATGGARAEATYSFITEVGVLCFDGSCVRGDNDNDVSHAGEVVDGGARELFDTSCPPGSKLGCNGGDPPEKYGGETEGRVGPSGLEARAQARKDFQTVTQGDTGGARGLFRGTAGFRDVVVVPPASFEDDATFTSVNFDFEGSLEASRRLNPPEQEGGASAEVEIDLTISTARGRTELGGAARLFVPPRTGANIHLLGFLRDVSQPLSCPDGTPLPCLEEQRLELGANSPYTTTSFVVPVDEEFSVFLDLAVDARAGMEGETWGDGSVRAAAAFANTLSFPSDGPVFNLPEGFTASSEEAMIVDNRFVPEPSATAGSAAALAAVAALALARRAPRRRPRTRRR